MSNLSAKEIIKQITSKTSKDELLIDLFERVRDIPYGDIGSRDPFEVFKANKGTCSGKHELLKALYHELGFETRDFIATHAFNDFRVDFPFEVKQHFAAGELLDPHNFFKVNNKGTWYAVDITWEKDLQRFGFPVNTSWNGTKDCDICVVTREVIEVSDPIGYKKEFLNQLSPEIQLARKNFLHDLTVWLDKVRFV